MMETNCPPSRLSPRLHTRDLPSGSRRVAGAQVASHWTIRERDGKTEPRCRMQNQA